MLMYVYNIYIWCKSVSVSHYDGSTKKAWYIQLVTGIQCILKKEKEKKKLFDDLLILAGLPNLEGTW